MERFINKLDELQTLIRDINPSFTSSRNPLEDFF